MEQRHNSAALISTALLFVVVVTLYLVPAFILHGILPTPPISSGILMKAAGGVSVLGLIQSWRIGGGLSDFVLGSAFSFSPESVKEHGVLVPVFIVFASNCFFLAALVSIVMLVSGIE